MGLKIKEILSSDILPRQGFQIVSIPDLDTEDLCRGVCPCATTCTRKLGSKKCREVLEKIEETSKDHEPAFTTHLKPLNLRRP